MSMVHVFLNQARFGFITTWVWSNVAAIDTHYKVLKVAYTVSILATSIHKCSHLNIHVHVVSCLNIQTSMDHNLMIYVV